MPTSHYSFTYHFDDDEGITFRDIPTLFKFENDLAIFYNSLDGDDFIDCKCSRWDVENYSVTVSTWLDETQLNTLMSNVTPGATGELYKILGRPTYYDQTWTGENTLRLYPTPSSSAMNGSNLKNMRKNTLLYVKNITTTTLDTIDWIHTKIEGFVSGSSGL